MLADNHYHSLFPLEDWGVSDPTPHIHPAFKSQKEQSLDPFSSHYKLQPVSSCPPQTITPQTVSHAFSLNSLGSCSFRGCQLGSVTSWMSAA